MPPRLHPPPPVLDMDGELTPELKSRVLDIELKTEEKKIDNEIESEWNCCMTIEKQTADLLNICFRCPSLYP